MNTKFLMIASAIVTGFIGLTASFFPTEIINTIGATTHEMSSLLIQITGALYLGFSIMNWMAKSVLIGGIYAKPLGMGNCLHFTVGALALFKFALNNHSSTQFWLATILYASFAILFGIVVFISPKQMNSKSL